MNQVCLRLIILFAAAVNGFAIETTEIIGPADPGGQYKHPTTFTQLDNGELYLAFYGGSGEYSTDTAVYGSRRDSRTKKWSTPKVIADTPFCFGRKSGGLAGSRWNRLAVLCGPLWRDLVDLSDSSENLSGWGEDMV